MVSGWPGSEHAHSVYDAVYRSHVCAGCSCLCDDVSFFVKDRKVVKTLNLCQIGMRRLLTTTAEHRLPGLSRTLLRDSLRRAIELALTKSPVLVIGAEGLDQSALACSLELTRALRGLWLPWAFEGIRRFFSAAADWGWATALLDEVRDKADLVVFWCSDPLTTHCRHLSRYSVFARGRCTERGVADRVLVGIGRQQNLLERLCRLYFVVKPEEDAAFIDTLVEDTERTRSGRYRDLPFLKNNIDRASYIAVFVDPEQLNEEGLSALFRWASVVNRSGSARCVVLPLLSSGVNVAGFIQCSIDLLGRPIGGDFSLSSHHVLEREGVDALSEWVGSVIMIDPSPYGHPWKMELPKSLADKPRVVITPFKQSPVDHATIVIPTKLPGIETEGTFFRADWVPLYAARLACQSGDGYPALSEVFQEMLDECTR